MNACFMGLPHIKAWQKNLQDRLPPKLKYASDFCSHERQDNVAEGRKRQRKAHSITHERLSGVRFLEGMVMNPFAIRALQLLIDKLKWRIPAADPRPPARCGSPRSRILYSMSAPSSMLTGTGVELKTKRWRRQPHEI